MNNPVKVKITDSGEIVFFALYSGEKVLTMVRELSEREELSESDYVVLPESEITYEEWQQHISNELDDMNWRSRSEAVTDAFKYMTPEKGIEYAKHLMKTLE